MAAKKRKVLKEVFDFSEWALQDTARAPLPPVASSDPPPARWLGVQSLASIATGRDGKVVVCDAAKRDIHFALGYVEGYRKATHIVMPLDAPRAVMDLFSNRLAKKVLQEPSFVARLEEAGGGNLALGLVIDGILAELDVCTPQEFEAMKAFCATCGFVGEQLPLRVSRVDGKLVMALIDAVMLAKKCTYAAAQRICHRLLLDYWHLDMEASGILEQTDLSSQVFHSLRLQEGSHGGRTTICVGAPTLAEVLILIPGCELSAQLRKDMVKSFFGVGGNEVTFEGLLSNPRIQAHLRDSEHPLGEFLEEREHKALMRRLPRLLLQRDEDLKERDEQWQQIVLARDEHWRAHEEKLRRELHDALVAESTAHTKAVQGLETSLLAALASRFGGQLLSIAGHVRSVVVGAVKEGMNLKKSQAKRRSVNAQDLPEDQRGTALQAGPLALGLSTVAVEILPDLCYMAWLKVRGSFGQHAMAERLRRHALGPEHADYAAQPRLWSYTGAVEGGGARRLYLASDRAMLRAVFLLQRTTSAQQRADGAPRPTESLGQRAQRVQKGLTRAEVAVPWPEHASGLEPDWDEM